MPEDGAVRRLLDRARRLDSGTAVVRAARATRELLPGDSELGDALSTAEGRTGHLIARHLADVNRRPSAAREVGLGLFQLYQVFSEKQGRGRGQRDVAILFTDLVEFSSWALEAGDDPALELLRRVGDCVEGSIRAHGGEVVKRLGDGHMAAFGEPAEAVNAASDAHGELREVEVEGYVPRLRAGVHLGRPRRLGGDYLGVDVNIAARIAAAASEGETLVSEPVVDRLDGDAFEVRRRRWFRAKGAPRDLQVYSVSRTR